MLRIVFNILVTLLSVLKKLCLMSNMKKEQIIYILIGVIITLIVGGGATFWILSNSNNPSVNANSNNNIDSSNSTILDVENLNSNTNQQVKDEATPIEPIEEATKSTNTATVTTTVTSASEINSLFQTHYSRDATQDELDWWKTKTYSELEATLTSNPQVDAQDTQNDVNTNTSPAPTNTVDPAIKIELCKSEAETAKTDATTTCTDAAMEAFRSDPDTTYWTEEQAECSTAYADILNPVSRNELITQCTDLAIDAIFSVRKRHLDGVPSCADDVYQSTYTDCLNE